MKVLVCILMSGLCFFNTSVFADAHIHGGGGFHGAPPENKAYHSEGNYNHSGNYNRTYDNGHHDNYYHNHAWDGGNVIVNTWGNGIWYDDNWNDDTNAVVGVPDTGYYDPSCQTIDDCSTGTCVLVNTCDQD